MFQGWRFRLREAEQAYREGRLEQAERILREHSLSEYLPGKRLSQKVAHTVAERAIARASGGDLAAAWRDLELVKRLVGESASFTQARRDLVDRVCRRAEQSIVAGEPAKAIEPLETLEKYGAQHDAVRRLREVARRCESARNLGLRGKYHEAEAQLSAAAALCPDLTAIAEQQQFCRERAAESRRLTTALHESVTNRDWTAVLSLADQLLEIAPESKLGLDARKRAWAAVGADISFGSQLQATQVWQPDFAVAVQHERRTARKTAERDKRFLLWVDGVGGYLVCLGEDIILGQSAPNNPIDVAFQADLSRRHAMIRRRDGYLIEPLHRVRIGGREILDTTLLRDGDEIELGENVRLRFRQPHALSATARLEIVSRHRIDPTADAILLMAESCVLGPKWQNHVTCRDWSNDVVLYRQDDRLHCRSMDAIEIDGQYCDGGGEVGLNSHVTGDDFSFSLEAIA